MRTGRGLGPVLQFSGPRQGLVGVPGLGFGVSGCLEAKAGLRGLGFRVLSLGFRARVYLGLGF